MHSHHPDLRVHCYDDKHRSSLSQQPRASRVWGWFAVAEEPWLGSESQRRLEEGPGGPRASPESRRVDSVRVRKSVWGTKRNYFKNQNGSVLFIFSYPSRGRKYLSLLFYKQRPLARWNGDFGPRGSEGKGGRKLCQESSSCKITLKSQEPRRPVVFSFCLLW